MSVQVGSNLERALNLPTYNDYNGDNPMKYTIAMTLLLALCAPAHAMGIGQVIQSYTDEATAELELYVGSDVSNYHMECIVAPDGNTAACEAQASLEGTRVSESFYCFRAYVGAEFKGTMCELREHHVGDQGSTYRY